MTQTALLELSYWLLYGALALYVLSFVSFALDLARRATWSNVEEKYRPALSLRLGVSFAGVGLVLHVGAIVTRGLAAGRVPWDNLFGFALISTSVVIAVFLLTLLRADLRFVGTFVLGLVIILLGGATVLYDVPIVPLAPPLQSGWLIFHVFVAALGLGFFGVGGALSIVQLLRQGHERRHPVAVAPRRSRRVVSAPSVSASSASASETVPASASAGGIAVLEQAETSEASETPAGEEGVRGSGGGSPRSFGAFGRFLNTFPSAEALESFAYRVNIVGFVFWTFTLIAGAIWAEAAWGRYWGWDTKEVWTFIIWVIYAGYIHARATRGWRGSPSAWLSIIGIAAVIFNSTIVNVFFKGLHAYSGL